MQVRVVDGGNVVTEVSSNIGSFNDSLDLTIQEDGFLGETANRFDSIEGGHSGDFEFQVNSANWENFLQRVRQKASRQSPDLVFNVIRTDFFADGGTVTKVFQDVAFGAFPRSTGGRADFVKVKASFKCQTVALQVNAI